MARTPSTCRYEGAAGAHPAVLAQLLCDGSAYLVARLADGSGVDLGRSARRPGAALRAAVLRRDGGRCRFPGCGSRRHLHLHHVRHWIAGGPTDLENLVTLCHYHHRRLHEEAFAIGTRPNGAFVFVLPDGERVPEHPDVQPTRGAPALADDPGLSGADRLAREAAEFFVRGQRLRLHDAVDALLRAAAA
ncbi:MAG: HNH endonuclease signature motif containing protein [Candidatus Nanopelagicales bacterium]